MTHTEISHKLNLKKTTKKSTPYDSTTQIETLYDQIELAVDIAYTGHATYTTPQILTQA